MVWSKPLNPQAPFEKGWGGGGGGISPSSNLPGEPEPIVEANRYICPQEGGHIVDRNPCPKHHGPTTLYGGD
ncbi:MAG TPA: hypothetical protein VGR02_00910 [Thermoanaerobaculia bacterium]|nr:hypothetical protein [Thermoanaerobaculia bacterium]